MTQITTIFGALAAMTPEWSSDVAIKVWNGSTAGVIKATLPSASVPIRILTTTGDIEGRDFAFIALGKLSKVTWVIEDLLLMKAVAEGDSIKGVSAHLVQYCDSYITKLRDVRAPAANSHVLRANMKPGTYDWGDVRYFGVKVIVEVEEFQSAA